MPKNLDEVTAATPKDVQITGVGVALHRFLDLQREAVHPAAHVGATNRQPDSNSTRNRYHRVGRSAEISAFSAETGYPAAISRRVPSGKVTMAWRDIGGASDVGTAVAAAVVEAPSIMTGMSCG